MLNTKIQWATHTFNPWIGCTKVSPGCAHCYAEVSTPSRAQKIKWGKGQPRQRTSPNYWLQPAKWNLQQRWACDKCSAVFTKPRSCPACERVLTQLRPRVFPSLCDWLDDEVPIDWLAEFLKLIFDTPNLDWLLLTKRPENFIARIQAARNYHTTRDADVALWLNGWLDHAAPVNVWLGVSVEDQPRADERIPELLRLSAPIRFLSVEPLLGPINLRSPGLYDPEKGFAFYTGCSIDWVIVGGESGPKARPCHVEWIESLVKQCAEHVMACFVKQLGGHCITKGSRLKLQDPKGGDPAEWPEALRVRQFPDIIPF